MSAASSALFLLQSLLVLYYIHVFQQVKPHISEMFKTSLATFTQQQQKKAMAKHSSDMTKKRSHRLKFDSTLLTHFRSFNGFIENIRAVLSLCS